MDKISLQWLQDNAYKWGFHNTYQKGIEIDGQMVEPWHRRYVGDELAEELYEKNLSLAERYNLEK
ncbi:D-alanyl-D-alanine carboxypeptidase family protein [bacterium]|nr:D-alanyl-D-alanine carboxypeptidase family protein [bacterium]